MTAPDSIQWQPEHRALILQTVIGELQAELDAIKKHHLATLYPNPTTAQFESPLDQARLGRVSRARVTPEWKVTAAAQLGEHLREAFPNLLETVYLLDVPGVADPVALPELHPLTQALIGAAPDLLTPQQRIPPEVTEAALQESRDTGQPAAPGIQLVRARQAALSVVPDKHEAVPAIGRLMAAGRLRWADLIPSSRLAAGFGDGRPALPGGDDQHREAS